MHLSFDTLEVTDALNGVYVFVPRNHPDLLLYTEGNSSAQGDFAQLLDRLTLSGRHALLNFWDNLTHSASPLRNCGGNSAEHQLVQALERGELCVFQVASGLETALKTHAPSTAAASNSTTAAANDTPRQQTQQASTAQEQQVAARTAESEAEAEAEAEAEEPSDWKNVSKEQFISDYTARYPNTTIADKLPEYYDEGMRQHPETGHLRNINTTNTPQIEAKPISTSEITFTHTKELKILEAQRKRAQLAKLRAIAKGDEEAEKAANQRMVNFSAAIGVTSARLVMAKEYPDFEELVDFKLPGKGEQGQFDLVYSNKNTGEVLVVEAKGGASTLGSRKALCRRQAQQGSPEYCDSVIANMHKIYKKALNAGKTPNEMKGLSDGMKVLKRAKRVDDKIHSILISQRLESDGSLKPSAKLIKFSNEPSLRKEVRND